MPCPDDIELAGFLNDSMSGEQSSHLSEHVDACPQCQARLDRLTQQASGDVARYKELSSGVLEDSKSSNLPPEADTQILGAKAALAAAIVGLPRVPGFDVMCEIGRGGMGIVYKARHRRLNRLVALKMILAGGAADPRIVQRFLFEAEVLARIKHPQVVQVFEVETFKGPHDIPIPYLAMELLEGGSLSRKLKDQAAKTDAGPRWLSPRAAAELVEGIARAVHVAHAQGVVHRDLKPGNILFSEEFGLPNADQKNASRRFSRSEFQLPIPVLIPKVTDFGLAKFIEAGADLTHTGQIVGTPQYMSPEQAGGSRQVGPAVDVYALGAILFECLTGRPPFTGAEPMSVLLKVVNEPPPDLRSLRPDVPRDLAAVTMKCLEKESERRYASAEALANDLRRFLDDRPTRARPATQFERLKLWGRRNPAVASLIAALAVVLVTAFTTVAALWVKAENQAKDAFDAKTRSELAQKRAEKETENAAASLLEMQKQKALLEFSRAVDSCEEGRVREGLLQFLSAAEIAEGTGQTDLARVARINLAAWQRDLPPTPRPFEHKEQPRLAAFHPDGKRFVTVGRKSEAYLWDIATGEKLRTYQQSKRFRFHVLNTPVIYWTVAISPDGKTIAAGGSDRSITLWDIDSPEPKAEFDAVVNDENLWSLVFSSNNVLWSNDGRHGLKRWDLSAKPVPKATQFSPRVPFKSNILQILAISTDGKRLYSGDRAGIVREWDTENGTERRSWQFNGWITDLAVSTDDTRLAATGTDGFVSVIDLVSGQQIVSINLAGVYGNGVAFAPKQPLLIASDGDGNLRFWHRETGQPIGIPMRFHGEVTRPRFRANSDEFAVGAGNSIYFSSVPEPPGKLLSAGYRHRIRGLAISPTGHLGIADDSRFELLDLANGNQLQLVRGWQEPPLTLAFDPDPARPVVYRGTRRGFDKLAVPGGQKIDESEFKHTAGLGRVFRIECLRGNGGLFVMGEEVVGRYDPATLKLLIAKRPAENIPAGVNLEAMAMRPDGKELLVAFADRIVLLESDTLNAIREWRCGDTVLSVCYTPDGKNVLLGLRNNKAELRDAVNGEATPVRAMTHTRAVTAVAVSADGSMFVTGSRDGTARFWDAASGLPLGAPFRHSGPVTHVTFTPTNDRIVTGTGAGHVMMWNMPPQPTTETIEELKARMK